MLHVFDYKYSNIAQNLQMVLSLNKLKQIDIDDELQDSILDREVPFVYLNDFG